MLKISDYVAIVLSFVAMLGLYLIVAHNLSISLALNELLNPVSLPESYDLAAEWESEEPEFAVVCGQQINAEETNEITALVSNLKKTYKVFPIVEDITDAQAQFVSTIIVTADTWEQVGNVDKLFQYAQEGVTVIFPHLMMGHNAEALNKTLGVLNIGESTEIKGILLSDKLMVQDAIHHDNLTCSVSRVTVDSRCSKLMVEWSDEEKEQKDLIPLLWEKRHGSGAFYVVNGDFLNERYGMGVLTGLLSCANDVFVYPVVNAKVNLLDSFPQLDNPYEDRLQAMYSRDSNMFVRDVVWPYMVKLCEMNELVITAHLENQPSAAMQQKFQALVDMMERRGCEVTIGEDEADFPVPYTVEGFTRSGESFFGVQCGVSGMALVSHYLDASEIMGMHADDPLYEWNTYSMELSKMMDEIYQDTEWVDAVTLSTAEERYKRYVMMQPEFDQADDSITIKTGSFDKMCFYLVRTEKPVSAGSNCEVTKVGEGAYLVKALDQEATLSLGTASSNRDGAQR